MFSSNTSQVSGGYQISRSLRFNSADAANLTRTPASASNRKTWTWSGWIKITSLSTNNGYLFTTTNANINNATYIYLNGNTLRYWDNTGSGGAAILTTTAVYRDVSAWYHIVLAVDTTQATAANRARLYVNGAEVTAFSTANYPPQNTDTYTNDTVVHYIGAPTRYFDGYMTEINFIDGQALTPSSFGETNAQTGVWQPKAYAGSYGTNGFYLNFSDNSNTTAATLGKDYSGNGNNWTPNNFSVAAGVGNDSLVDTPTPYGSDTGAGGEVRGNYATLNPIDGVGFTAANGNLDVTVSSATGAALGTISVSSGKWYWEVAGTGGGAAYMIGVANAGASAGTKSWQGANGWYYYGINGQKYTNGSGTSYGSTYSTGVVIGVALDMDAGTVTFYRNGVSQGAAYSSFSGLTMQPSVSSATGNEQYSINFGQRPFAYTAPSGFRALCTQNLPTPTIGATTATQAGQYFNPVLYTGDRTSRTIDVGFQPDWVWVKSRNAADDHYLMNAVVGTGKYLVSNSAAAEVTNAASLTAFTSNGFSIGNTGTTNETGRTYVAWNWKANGAGSTNTAGSITATVSANTTSGFSIATLTPQSSGNGTFGHGLGVAPSMVIIKPRNSANSWIVWHTAIPASDFLVLNTTAAKATEATYFNSTLPTSTVVTLGTAWNGNTGVVAYCFAEVPGYSRFGSYVGNGSADGPFVYCGFRPRWIMYKDASASYSWVIVDTARQNYNVMGPYLLPNSSDAEGTATIFDILSNGFKVRVAGPNTVNTSGDTIVFAAFAESPFKYSIAR